MSGIPRKKANRQKSRRLERFRHRHRFPSGICGGLPQMLHAALSMFFVLIWLLHPSQLAQAQVAKLFPVDEAYRDPSFFIFRARLLEAVQQRDADFVFSVLSPNVLNSFGGDGGIAEFKEQWHPERPDSKLWNSLVKVLALGGSFFGSGNIFQAPYMFSKYPNSLDGYFHGVVIGENITVRQSPKVDSPAIATLSYDIVEVPEWTPTEVEGTNEKWIAIKLSDGRQGFVAEKYIRNPIDYRAIFEKKDGQWQLTALVAGD